jgi:hypothetical protein
MAVRAAALALLLALAAFGAAAADDAARTRGKSNPAAGRCVNQTRQDEKACVKRETERCRSTFETELVGCFHANADCPRKCIAAHTSCRTTPKTTQEGCQLACASDLKVALAGCKQKADEHGCESPERVKALKCKQKCAADSAPALEDCARDFDDCLSVCLRAAAP